MSRLKRVLVPAHCISTNEHKLLLYLQWAGVGNSVIEITRQILVLSKVLRGNTGVRRHVMCSVGWWRGQCPAVLCFVAGGRK